MKRLNDIVGSKWILSKGLQENGFMHRNYNWYTSMERALGFLLSGDLFITNGENWNDKDDGIVIKKRELYAKCFSCSTRENIAMWMLYGDKRGKNGALLNFYPSVIKEITNAETLLLGSFDEGKYIARYKINNMSDYEIYLSDVLYVDYCKNDKVRLTCGDEHVVVNKEILNHEDIFYKNYAWEYERECRLIVRLSEKWKKQASDEKLDTICIKLSNEALTKMRKRDITRSPVYCGGAENGKKSILSGSIKWEL